jgi:hypothetical protein
MFTNSSDILSSTSLFPQTPIVVASNNTITNAKLKIFFTLNSPPVFILILIIYKKMPSTVDSNRT